MSVVADDSASGVRNPGSQAALRQLNEQRIIEALTALGSATQVEISKHTGLSAATVSNIVKQMSTRGIVVTNPTTRSGRRALSVRLDTKGAVAAGIDFGRRHVRVALASYNRTLIGDRSIDLPTGHTVAQGLDLAKDLLSRLLAEHDLGGDAVLGVGVGLPGPVDRRTGTIVPGRNLPEWEGIPLVAEMQRRLEHPVYMDNDANFGALAQVTWGEHVTVENLIFVKIGSGIGCGLIVNGSPFYGHIGVTGEIGHTTIDPHGASCPCGNRGCLETIASTSTMIDRLSHGQPTRLTTEEIISNAGGGDTATLRVIEDAGVAVGRALADVANLLNPETIVIGGPLTGLGETLLTPIRRGLVRNALPVIGETTTIVMSPLGELAEVLGAAAMVLHRGVAPSEAP